jgi:hypothetical protein
MRSRPTWPLAALLIPLVAFPAAAQVPSGWEKVSGPPESMAYSGIPDGLAPTGDRQNSYAWSMDVLGDHLYVGTNRNVFMLMVQQVPWGASLVDFTNSGAKPVPLATDMRARIYRMSLASGAWDFVYAPPPAPGTLPLQGIDAGYRMMKTFEAAGRAPVLYVGGSGIGACRLLAIAGDEAPREIFRVELPGQFVSIRAIAQHDGKLYWASEDAGGAALWLSPDPLGDHLASPRREYERVPLPAEWTVDGAEIVDLIGYAGWLHVYFLTKTQDPAEFGFWAAKVKKIAGRWSWKLVVGGAPGARYPAGMGNPENGVAVPFRFRNRVYVGTMDAAAFRLLNGITQPSPGTPTKVWGDFGMEIWRFDQRDVWERVMPAPSLQGDDAAAARGFGNPNNKYMWRFGALDGRLFVGTFDVGTGQRVLAPPFAPPPPEVNPLGFDLYSSRDGVDWASESENGFDDPWNYGVRSFATDPATGDLYLGTANPFFGCQVWRKRASDR